MSKEKPGFLAFHKKRKKIKYSKHKQTEQHAASDRRQLTIRLSLCGNNENL